ncbi:MAG: NAD(P)/FAD-dependent oxidoreductase, partial [Balneolaceae bacterium]|nr:NAD(P)/FAD-dependent oxidoreductase [Balneolaceae bacterium]
NLTEKFLDEGLKIRTGIAFWNRNKIGTISFNRLPGPHKYILAIPQWRTESILSDKVRTLDPDSLIRGAEVKNIVQGRENVEVSYQINGETRSVISRFAVGCDGKSGFIRDALEIPFRGKPYPDTYIMGDYTDNTSFGEDAAVFLHEEGLIECFPLPDGRRRWVAKTDEYIRTPHRRDLDSLIESRLNHSIQDCQNSMISSFGVQHLLADSFYTGRCLIAGDAAHVVSPIGGQGMNLGWLDAEAAFHTLRESLNSEDHYQDLFKKYSEKQRKIASHVARRAELNMHLGRKETSGPLYKAMVKLMLRRPFSGIFAKMFTMQGLGKWPL